MIVATITDRHNRVNYHLVEMFGHGSTPRSKQWNT